MTHFEDEFYTDDFDQQMMEFVAEKYGKSECNYSLSDSYLKYGTGVNYFWTSKIKQQQQLKYLTKQQFKEKIGMTTKAFTKADLKTGMILVFANGDYASVLLGTKNGDIITGDTWLPLADHEDGKLFSAKEVRKVLQPRNNKAYNLNLAKKDSHWTEYEVVWEYKEKSQSQIELEKLQQQIAELQAQANKLQQTL